MHSKLAKIAHVCTVFDLPVHTFAHTKSEWSVYATPAFTKLKSGSWRVQVTADYADAIPPFQ
jgi:hypothetical protein